MRISDWSSDVCSSDAVNLRIVDPAVEPGDDLFLVVLFQIAGSKDVTCSLYLFDQNVPGTVFGQCPAVRHGQHSYAKDRKSTRLNFQSLMRISYAVFCLKKKKQIHNR